MIRPLARTRPIPLLLVLAAACDEPPPPLADLAASPDPPAPTVGVDPALLERARRRGEELPRLRSLIVARHGEVEAEWYFHGEQAGRRANIKSASKSVLSALVGIAIEEGHLEGVDQPVAPFFHDELPAEADPRLREITIGHLLSMRSGLESTSFGNYGRFVTSPNWVRHVLSRPFAGDPGGRMIYSTGSTHLLSAILERATGTSTWDYAREKLGQPLDIEIRRWTRDPQGVYFGGNEMRLTPRALLRFGELYRNGGVHEGTRVLPEAWVEASWTRRTASPWNGHGYGYGWWARRAGGHDVRFAWGYGGQYVFVVPALELTVVMTSDASAARDGGHNRALHDMLAELLVPAAERGRRQPA